MFQFLGILFLVAGLAALVITFITIKEGKKVTVQNSWGEKVNKTLLPSPDWMLSIKKSLAYGLMIGGVMLFLIPYLFFFAERGYSYLLVHPGGKLDAVMTQGIKWRGFAKIDPWQKYIDVKVVADDVEYDEKELEGVMRPVPLRFIDQVTATGFVSTRFELPHDKESFIDLAIKYRSMSNLVNNTIIPTVKEQLVQTAYMFAAQDYISGEAQQFRQTFDEQLKDGTYRVEKIEYRDTVFSEITSTKDRIIKDIKTTYEVNKQLENGVPVRIPHELTENGIIVSQVIVDQITLEDAFKARLEAQRDESAKRQLEQQKIETAKATQQRIVAEGERDKAAERVAQEKEQVKTLIAIETKLKEEKTNKELATIALETQRIESQTVKVKADAEAYEIQKKVYAGITPEKRLQMELDANVKVATELAKIKFPETLIIGGADGKTDGNLLETLIGAELAKGMVNKSKK